MFQLQYRGRQRAGGGTGTGDSRGRGGRGGNTKPDIEKIGSINTGRRLIINLREGLKRVRIGTGRESDKSGS